MTGNVSAFESAGDLRRALELADRLTQERHDLQIKVVNLEGDKAMRNSYIHSQNAEIATLRSMIDDRDRMIAILVDEKDALRAVILDLVYSYQNHEGGWDRMERPIAEAKSVMGMLPAEEVEDDDLLGPDTMTPFDG